MMISGYASNYGVVCNTYIVEVGAFGELVRRGTRPPMWLNHEGPAIGEWVTISDDERGLFVTGRLWDTARAREAIDLYNEGCLTGLSLGPKGAVWKTMRRGIKVISVIDRIDEISLVGEPRDPAALIESFCVGSC
ncbi:HK97 family phage prohead protease [Mesorhizobium sp.]|uniref:HK97 family phage prohead protease n=1 Tax=Mesorhizobium sp. TaxID=1871066 RepID=UPI000FE79B58|nr:HK97 family phage prohead protease [Mesorhizobium sp.]RWN28889.1 MAG: hypothetical protein EOR95_22930 [Mesorhizobium sp.]